MRTVTILAGLIIMVRLSGQGTENPLPDTTGSNEGLIVFTYSRQFSPEIKSVSLLLNGKGLYPTLYNRLREGSVFNLKSRVKSTIALLMRFVLDKCLIDYDGNGELIIPVKFAGERKLFLLPEHRLIIAFTERVRPIPRIKPIVITDSDLSLWLSITL